jgi:hypothetical protein
MPTHNRPKLLVDGKPFVEQIQKHLLSRGLPLKERDESDDSRDEGGHKRDHGYVLRPIIPSRTQLCTCHGY